MQIEKYSNYTFVYKYMYVANARVCVYVCVKSMCTHTHPCTYIHISPTNRKLFNISGVSSIKLLLSTAGFEFSLLCTFRSCQQINI